MRIHRSIFALALGLLGLAAHAPAQTVINSAPYTISASGHYVLGGNLNSAVVGPAIKINAPNVILDLNGFYVAGPGNPAAANNVNNAVISVGDVANVTIKNGTVAGNAFGINYLSSTPANLRNYVVDHVTITRCYLSGIYCYYAAPGSLIKNCSFSTIGNSTSGANTSARAIFAYLGGFRIEKNNIGDVTDPGANGSYGIQGGNSNFIIGNTIANCGIAISGGKCLNNLTYNVTTAFQGTTNANGNN